LGKFPIVLVEKVNFFLCIFKISILGLVKEDEYG
jgi:hypothetical protein